MHAFQTYYDSRLQFPTPYGKNNRYVKNTAPRIEETVHLLKNTIPNAKILDLGATPLHFLFRCQQLGAKSVTGVYYTEDPHPLDGCFEVWSPQGRIDITRLNLLQSKLPYPDDCYDLVVAMEIFEHFPVYPRFLLSEITRVLCPGGEFVVTVPNVCRYGNIIKLCAGRNVFMPYKSDPFGRHVHEYTKAQLQALLVDGLHANQVRVDFLSGRRSKVLWKLEKCLIACGLKTYFGNIIMGRATIAGTLAESQIGIPSALFRDVPSTEI